MSLYGWPRFCPLRSKKEDPYAVLMLSNLPHIVYSFYRLYDFRDILDKLTHFLPKLSEFVPLENGVYSFRAHID